MAHEIRNALPADLAAVLALNEGSVPAVNSVSLAKMRWFLDNAAYFRVATDGEELGAFMIGLRAGTDYESGNYRWFCRHYDDFGYIDRIAVARIARRQGIATRLYEDFRATLPESVLVMTCEVNLKPPNAASMEYHAQLGFSQVGSRIIDNGGKKVALLERKL
ncbi:MAG: GNAT family N-acetyltransferase [Woeseiaceae bacterium]|nr:GNAT family N-acetyltransferase [Woeseiaceae bacterium]